VRARLRHSVVAVCLLIVVTAGTAAAAAPGDPFKLGVLNTINNLTRLEGNVTTALLRITNATGPALDLRVPAAKAPLVVNSSTKVVNLNADKIDSVDSTQLQRRVTGICPAGQSIRAIGAGGGVTCELDNGKDLARTVIVSPVGTAVQNGTALLAAHNAIVGASATNPYLLKIEPGQFNLGTQSLVMKPFVDVEGSGQAMTTIIAGDPAGCCTGTVQGASNAWLRSLSVVNTGSAEGEAYAIFATAAAGFVVDDVFASAQGSTDNAGIAVYAGTFLDVRDSGLSADGGLYATGIYLEDSSVSISDTVASAGAGTTETAGLWLVRSHGSVSDSTFISVHGVRLDGTAGSGSLQMRGSEVSGSTNRVLQSTPGAYDVEIGTTWFVGGPALGIGSLSCAQSYETVTDGTLADVAGDCN
jgi:hypothetical protein